jgi:hypothetical protein
MANLGNFDASQVEPNTEFEPVPAGKYVAAITASEMKPNKAGTGSYLELQLQILDGEYKGRNLWARLNLDNPNVTAVQIARGQLSAICRAVGVLQPKDSGELHDLPLQITVKVKRRDDNGELSNEVSGFAKRESATGRPPQAAGNTPPWARN